MKNKNIIIFSSGVSEQHGIVDALSNALGKKGYICTHWRDLFSNAKNSENIALLPMLIKKIPTFDYAVMICEGHDTTVMRRGNTTEQVSTMRDNVLFEIGLCVMALGLSRTILLTDGIVRLPDDLTGIHNEIALKRIIYQSSEPKSYLQAENKLLAHLEEIERTSTEIDAYIRKSGNELTPVVIGAAASIACGYVSNFIFRTLEHIHEGISVPGQRSLLFYPNDTIYIHIILPRKFEEQTSERAREYMSIYPKAYVPTARSRRAEFQYKTEGEELHIIDFPTSIVTSYDTAKIILNLEADDLHDTQAEKRFTEKELNLFESALKVLLTKEYLQQVIEEQYASLSKQEQTVMQERVLDIITNRLKIEHLDV